jgi:Alr-MurF fusion protein
MQDFSLLQFADYLSVSVQVKATSKTEFKEIVFDSRKVFYPVNSLFVAIKSNKGDGHKYIKELAEKGVANFIVERDTEIKNIANVNYILVDNAIDALQKIATQHRNQFTFPIVGITGSNGKTIVKEWLYSVLQEDYKIYRSPKSFNSQLGVPISVLQINQGNNFAIIEAGISQPNEMHKLASVIQPDWGIFTNIGSAHAENFNSFEERIQEKMQLFERCTILFYCTDHALIHQEVTQSKQLANCQKITWGKQENAQLRVISSHVNFGNTLVRLIWQEHEHTLTLPFADSASVENLMHVCLLMLHLGYNFETIQSRILQLQALEMRLEIKAAINNSVIINDAYSADIESLKIALNSMEQQVKFKQRILFLSDFYQTGKSKEDLYSEISLLIKQKEISLLIGVGEEICALRNYFPNSSLFFKTTNDCLDNIAQIPIHNACILLKGARVFEFEKIADVLQEKSHETVLEINLSALLQNLNYYRSLLKPNVKMMAMVKAFSYGSGSAEIANVLQHNGVDYLAVAYADEGIALRKAGITLPIMVMNPEKDGLLAMIEHQLAPEIYNFRILEAFSEIAKNRAGYEENPIKIQLKLDTGMHRLGFEEADLPELCKRINAMPWFEVEAVFSHLAASSDPDFDDFTQLQIQRFTDWSNYIQQQTDRNFLRHILNSGGISRHVSAHFDMVRLGIGLYGIGSKEEQPFLQHVSTLKTTISQIKELAVGETVGYNRRGKITQSSRIATLPIGYADGFLRKLGNGKGCVFINGQAAFTVGGICMDMCMIDITHLPQVKEGDTVIVFGNPQHIHQMAEKLDTIPYEVLTGISARVKRIYFQE